MGPTLLPHCFPQIHPIHLLPCLLQGAMPLKHFDVPGMPGLTSADPNCAYMWRTNRITELKQVCSHVSEAAFSPAPGLLSRHLETKVFMGFRAL